MTTDADRRALLGLARESITARVAGQTLPSPPLLGTLARKCGAFVTLHLRKDLRGCIGHIGEDEALGLAIPRCAAAAASEDPRFPHLTAGELHDVDIEISLLSPLERIEGPAQVEIGRHGLVVELGWKRGLLLPQVATEWGWDSEAFLSHTCQKAGLPRDAWKQGATIWRFEAEIFGEEPPAKP